MGAEEPEILREARALAGLGKVAETRGADPLAAGWALTNPTQSPGLQTCYPLDFSSKNKFIFASKSIFLHFQFLAYVSYVKD